MRTQKARWKCFTKGSVFHVRISGPRLENFPGPRGDSSSSMLSYSELTLSLSLCILLVLFLSCLHQSETSCIFVNMIPCHAMYMETNYEGPQSRFRPSASPVD